MPKLASGRYVAAVAPLAEIPVMAPVPPAEVVKDLLAFWHPVMPEVPAARPITFHPETWLF